MMTTGFDIQNIDEVEESYATFGDRYLRRLFSDRELAECATSDSALVKRLAARFAAKEAVLKALEPDDHIPPWRSIEVLFAVGHAPAVVLRGEAEALARLRGVAKFHLSVGFTREYAIAAVTADVVQS
jgi:holo-[acyl-carrier protein] synthase